VWIGFNESGHGEVSRWRRFADCAEEIVEGLPRLSSPSSRPSFS
jgi:hypothetical protein